MKRCFNKTAYLFPLLSAGLLFLSQSAGAQFLGPSVAGGPTAAAATAAAPDYAEMRIVPGDIVSIATLGAPELTTLMSTPPAGIGAAGASAPVAGIRVGSRGEVNIPYAGTIVLAGMTPAEASRAISQIFKEKGILVDPQVTVQIADSPTRVITVIGEVQKPAPIPGFARLRLLDVISACGGFTPLASHSITIRRPGVTEPLSADIGTDPRSPELANVQLLPGDTVIVPTIGRVFVLGQVKNQQSLSLAGNSPLTVMRAVAVAGGVNYGAALSKARVIRTVDGNRHVEIMFDLAKVMRGKQQDIALQADDVLYVPSNAFKYALSGGGASVASSLFYGSVIAIHYL